MTTDDGSADPSRPTRGLWLRVVLGVLIGFVVLFACVLWLLTHLEHPSVKSRVEAALSGAVGTELTYDRLSISPFSGLVVEGLVLETPASLRAHAAEMLRLDRLEVPIELGSLLSGDIVVPEAMGGAVTLTVVVSEDGKNSFGEFASSEPDEPDDQEAVAEPSLPLSRALEPLEEIPLRIGPVRLAPIRVRVLHVADGKVETEITLASLALSSDGIELGDALRGSLRVASAEDDHVVVSVVDAPSIGAGPSERRARLVPTLEVDLEGDRTVGIRLHTDLVEQSVFPQLAKVNVLLHADSIARFRPDESRTNLEIESLTVFDQMLVAKGTATIDDDASARIDGEGEVDVRTLPWAVSWLAIENLSAGFQFSQLALESGEVTSGDAEFSGSLGRLRYDDDVSRFGLRGARVEGKLSSPEGATRTVGLLSIDASIDELETSERGVYRANLRDLDVRSVLRGVGVDDEGMWGIHGEGSLDGSLRALTVDAGTRARGKDASLELNVDLGRRRVTGRIPVAVLTFKQRAFAPIVLRRAELAVVADEPLRWTVDDARPTIDVDASVARVSSKGKHFRAKDWTLRLERAGLDAYVLESRISADRVSWGRFQEAAESSLALHAIIDAARPALTAEAALSIAGKAETTLGLNASHDSPVTRYDIEAVGSQAGPILGALLFDDGGMKGDELDFSFRSNGEFRGLLRESRDGSLRLSKEPLRTMRGTHASSLRVERASLARNGILHEAEGLTVEAKSTHESPGRGTLEMTASLEGARYGEVGWELTIREYEHELRAAYAALYGAPSFEIETTGNIGEVLQPYFRQYPVRDVVFGARADVDDTQVVAIREAYFRNPAGGTKFEARAAYEGWQDDRDAEVCVKGTEGCPQVLSMYGREAAMVTGRFEQDFGFWRSTERTKSSGSFTMPFTIETGDLNTYRVLASAEFRDVVLELPQYGLLIDDLDALIPVEQELATTPRFFIVPSKKANAMAQKRFFDLYPFTKRDSFFTVDQIQFGKERIGPMAANLQVVGSTLAMDQLHASYRSGFITGQVLGDLSVEDPKFVFRGNLTGVEPSDGRGVLDANVAMTFVPTTLILEGKAQVVRISKDHLYEMIDVIDPYHEDEDLNRVRLGLRFGYPKFVLLKLDEGLMDAKIDFGGLAGAVRIDEIKGIPVTPFLERYVQPYLERVMSPTAAARAMITEHEGT